MLYYLKFKLKDNRTWVYVGDSDERPGFDISGDMDYCTGYSSIVVLEAMKHVFEKYPNLEEMVTGPFSDF